MINVGIIGATGYTGAELVRLLGRHPQAKLVGLTSRTYRGEPYWRVYPHLNDYVDLDCEELDLVQLVSRTDVVFTALPHGHSMDVAREVLRQGKKLVDLGADFRLRQSRVYEQWYGVTHTATELLNEAVYGLPELYRESITEARLVANPGCYPTASILALAPLLCKGLVYQNSIIVDAKSGVSGAGRQFSLKGHFAETNENFQAYNVAAHRHTPEIEQELSLLAGAELLINFTPHLVPMTRGILATVYVNLKNYFDREELYTVFAEFYRDEPFVRVLPPGVLPQTKAVAGSNHCDIGIVSDSRTNRAIILSAIDNLVKGASGQAIQNMNLLFGLDETTGLMYPGLYP
ncbi:MAG: N-acetyl-gamma-glutamyl-phosphate reductase [Desulforudis sp.]|nr:N-acetyl-gamma-glutamyl-phosphate reductase [Clostridia bacterium]MDQ7792096.1 N-acetyl-gamma-glutamyl-phosphate reductase [Clostridia bacterium]RJX20549.1 MAG: N-acetyl-gamma-glutamyl-phosphate reductase [Desulforudis sp.]